MSAAGNDIKELSDDRHGRQEDSEITNFKAKMEEVIKARKAIQKQSSQIITSGVEISFI
jgi:hypothetical protein